MIITKEQQEALLNRYIKQGNKPDACLGFLDGIIATLDLLKKIEKNDNNRSI